MSTEQETTGKQDCVKPDEREDFIESGKCLDEITFVFDDGQKLYVSQNFLHYVSPVFKAMFEHDYEEKTTRTVKLHGKNRDDFLEFLQCLHPNKQKPVDKNNVMRIASIAEEYQSTVVVDRCKKTIIHWLNEAQSTNSFDIAEAARDYLRILRLVVSLHYEKIEQNAIVSLGKLPYQYFTGKPCLNSTNSRYFSRDERTGKCLSDSEILYDSLDEKLKNKILLSRLKVCDKNSDYHK